MLYRDCSVNERESTMTGVELNQQVERNTVNETVENDSSDSSRCERAVTENFKSISSKDNVSYFNNGQINSPKATKRGNGSTKSDTQKKKKLGSDKQDTGENEKTLAYS